MPFRPVGRSDREANARGAQESSDMLASTRGRAEASANSGLYGARGGVAGTSKQDGYLRLRTRQNRRQRGCRSQEGLTTSTDEPADGSVRPNAAQCGDRARAMLLAGRDDAPHARVSTRASRLDRLAS